MLSYFIRSRASRLSTHPITTSQPVRVMRGQSSRGRGRGNLHSSHSERSQYNQMASPSVSTLQHVTKRKLGKLSAISDKFETDKQDILAKVATVSDPREKVEALLDGFERHGISAEYADLSIENLKRFVHQAKFDPSISEAILADWQSKLEHSMNVVSTKYEYATLFGNLVLEWVKHPNPAVSTPGGNASGADSDSEAGESFDAVGRKEMHEQRKEWEDFVFTERKVDEAKIEAYLKEIFGETKSTDKVTKSPLDTLRGSMSKVLDFKSELKSPKAKESNEDMEETDGTSDRFTVDSLKSCITGVLKSDLFAGKKREALADLQNQPAVLKELVEVLNMDLKGLDEWEWDPSPVPLSMRRQLNGKYRVYQDEETHQAILLHFVGKKWACALRNAFTAFYQSDGTWLELPFNPMDKKARQRREYFGVNEGDTMTRDWRRMTFANEYFMTQLPKSEDEDYVDYAAEDQDEKPEGAQQSPHVTKQAMLRLITTELLLNKKLHGEFTVLQSDFKWFGPSLPHDTIFAVLKYLGVPPKWLRFFQKYLQPTTVFIQDGLNAEARTRKCGIPMSHILSDALSEAVLFCLDFAVNQRTKGANLYRFHDDLWFWGQESRCVQAWETMQEFSAVMGLELNIDKTGCTLVVDAPKARPLSPSLPGGPIKWGFLKLDAPSGRWLIDRAEVDLHIAELRRQLSACRSVLAWVAAWNSYLSRFFSTHFGAPANCLGKAHNEMLLSTYAHIQASLFADTPATPTATSYLRSIIAARFPATSTTPRDPIPDAFFYLPPALGGLGLRNPLVPALITHRKTFYRPDWQLESAFEKAHSDYQILKARWDSGETQPRHRLRPADSANASDSAAGDNDEPFLSFDEYMRYAEETSLYVCDAYVALTKQPKETFLWDEAKTLATVLRDRDVEASSYWMWVCNLYAGEMRGRFGGMQFGEAEMLPLGLLEVLGSERVRWEG